jgi:AraC-like DNA-binding protein
MHPAGTELQVVDTDKRAGEVRAPAVRESTVSLRWLLPFLRVTGTAPSELGVLSREGVTPPGFADPDTRIRHAALVELVQTLARRANLPALGLRAGARLEVADLSAFGYALRSCRDLRAAIGWSAKYMRLVHGSLECRLVEDADLARWELRVTDNVPQPPAVNDFALAACVSLARELLGKNVRIEEVHFQHLPVIAADEYARSFGTASVRFGMRRNALVFKREVLRAPLVLAHAGLLSAYEARAELMLEHVQRTEGIRGRVRQLLLQRLGRAHWSVSDLARELSVSSATLRARLRSEGTSYGEILQQVRLDMAEEFLTDRELGIGEVSARLGFSQVSAFYRAFRRWLPGVTPREFRRTPIRPSRLAGRRRSGIAVSLAPSHASASRTL